MRKLFAILLLAAFLLPFLSPLLAWGEDGEMSLPACCRRAGSHHCSMKTSVASEVDSHAFRVSMVAEKCPCCPAIVQSATHPDPFTACLAEAIFAGWVSHPCGVAQTESRRRIARDRARQKRGPPVTVLA